MKIILICLIASLVIQGVLTSTGSPGGSSGTGGGTGTGTGGGGSGTGGGTGTGTGGGGGGSAAVRVSGVIVALSGVLALIYNTKTFI